MGFKDSSSQDYKIASRTWQRALCFAAGHPVWGELVPDRHTANKAKSARSSRTRRARASEAVSRQAGPTGTKCGGGQGLGHNVEGGSTHRGSTWAITTDDAEGQGGEPTITEAVHAGPPPSRAVQTGARYHGQVKRGQDQAGRGRVAAAKSGTDQGIFSWIDSRYKGLQRLNPCPVMNHPSSSNGYLAPQTQ